MVPKRRTVGCLCSWTSRGKTKKAYSDRAFELRFLSIVDFPSCYLTTEHTGIPGNAGKLPHHASTSYLELGPLVTIFGRSM